VRPFLDHQQPTHVSVGNVCCLRTSVFGETYGSCPTFNAFSALHSTYLSVQRRSLTFNGLTHSTEPMFAVANVQRIQRSSFTYLTVQRRSLTFNGLTRSTKPMVAVPNVQRIQRSSFNVKRSTKVINIQRTNTFNETYGCSSQRSTHSTLFMQRIQAFNGARWHSTYQRSDQRALHVFGHLGKSFGYGVETHPCNVRWPMYCSPLVTVGTLLGIITYIHTWICAICP
jgi:hypothetical protein